MDAVKFARRLRRDESRAESLFWDSVRNRKFMGLKFKRQVPVNKYFADFLSEDKKVIIELDDISHAHKLGADGKRTKILEQYGYRVFRFTNEEIYEDLNAVLLELSYRI